MKSCLFVFGVAGALLPMTLSTVIETVAEARITVVRTGAIAPPIILINIRSG